MSLLSNLPEGIHDDIFLWLPAESILSCYDCFKIDIYTLRKDSWTGIQGTVKFLFRCGKGYYGVSFNGCLHWLGSIENTQGTSSEVIFSFHISNEIVVNMPLPENIIMPPMDYSGDVYKNVAVWGDCIGIACIWGSVKIDVWVMQEYGWSKRILDQKIYHNPATIALKRHSILEASMVF
ncbi:F-box/kelch-repeat protein At3g06240-like isoform X1 [Papaver somniferum]|uniref:F-box/kelch-repeat protein At3g06240-like isoform X1 n=1 Tax=Papaver somniferum TaxID=3469 RepID=UPI000E6F4AFB|nr:F-box/kelch-repeat protein At3g06240-like isoform X1 [Papaver somniferum]